MAHETLYPLDIASVFPHVIHIFQFVLRLRGNYQVPCHVAANKLRQRLLQFVHLGQRQLRLRENIKFRVTWRRANFDSVYFFNSCIWGNVSFDCGGTCYLGVAPFQLFAIWSQTVIVVCAEVVVSVVHGDFFSNHLADCFMVIMVLLFSSITMYLNQNITVKNGEI